MTTETTTVASPIEQAARTYIARRDRTAHPSGKFDNKSRWYPSEAEHCDCCDAIRSPSAKFPFSYMTHCRTLEHVAHLYHVDVKDLRAEVKRIEGKPVNKPQRLAGTFYKAVALLDDGRMVSIFDGQTEYTIGQELRQAVRKGHGGGYYVYRTVAEAQSVAVPESSKFRTAKRAILKVQASGQYTTYDNNKIAFSRVMPVEVVAVL